MEDQQQVNIPLLRKAVEWAEAEAAKPWGLGEWYQADTVVTNPTAIRKDPECGTCFCVAGFVAAQQDERFAVTPVVDGRHAVDVASEALGLPDGWAALTRGGLFSGGNTIADVRRIAEDIAGERL